MEEVPLQPAPTLRDLYRARRTLAGQVVRTPLVRSTVLSAHFGREIHLKLETVQHTGSFKLRGALNRLAALTPAERERGVVTMSTGNHGRAVSYAAQQAGVRAVVCMSSLVPGNKVEAVRALGAEVHIAGRSQDEAAAEVARLVAEEGLTFVPPFDDAAVVAGQGTIGLEIMEDLPDTRTVLVPLSGGGLIAGVALAVKGVAPDARTMGISMEHGAAMIASQRAGRPVAVEEVASLADSLGGGIGEDNRYTFALVRRLVDEFILVTEREIADAMTFAYRHERLVLEGAAAVGIAALLADRVPAPEGPLVLVVSGGNVDMGAFHRVVSGTPISG